MSLDDVAKVTKIQPRILERLEAGKAEGLPADVFVRGFVRSFARCVGLEEAEALRRYAACGLGAGSPSVLGALPLTAASDDPARERAAQGTQPVPVARALVEAMAELVPDAAQLSRTAPNKIDVVDLAAGSLRDLEVAAVVANAAPSEPVVEPAVAADAVLVGESVAPVAPAVEANAAEPAAVSPPVLASASASHSGKKRRRRKRDRRMADVARLRRELLATGTPAEASPVVAQDEDEPADRDAAVDSAAEPAADAAKAAEVTEAAAAPAPAAAAAVAPAAEPAPAATWSPRMPAVAASVPWRRPAYAAAAATAMVPSLVIDDADPDSAERVLEERAERAEKQAPRRSFLPPILLDREDHSARQGGLTLAVILLLIAATLTLSYLMRRPSATGDGMTRIEQPATTQA